MRTRQQEAAHLYAVQHLMRHSLWRAPVVGRKPHQHWDEPPRALELTQEQWDGLVDAEVAPFVGGRVYVHGDALVPESVALAGGAR